MLRRSARVGSVALALGVALASCAAPAARVVEYPRLPAGTTDAPPAPVLRIGTSGDYPPFSADGEGFDIDVARLMAADLGYRIEWVPFTWPGLAGDVERGAFDVAMGGITWRPERAVVGSMSRAVAVGAPCLLSDDATLVTGQGRVAVNRGGILERWARARWPADAVTAVDDNRSLPERLARGEVDAVVTDSFEIAHFRRPGWRETCEPARDRKVYWVTPVADTRLAPAMDAWLAEHEARLREIRAQRLGNASPRDEVDHLVDLLARRLELMPAVAAYKRARGLPIEDREREAVVLAQAIDAAARHGLDRASVQAFFEAQIALAKAVQARSTDAAAMDLATVLRPALEALDTRILASLAASVAELPRITPGDLELLAPLLDESERERLLEVLRSVQ